MAFNKDTAKGVALAIVIVPLAFPAFLLSWYLRFFSGGNINLDEKLVQLINKLPDFEPKEQQ